VSTGGFKFSDAHKRKPIFQQHFDCANHDARLGCGWPLQQVHDAESWLKRAVHLWTGVDEFIRGHQKKFGRCATVPWRRHGSAAHTLVQILGSVFRSSIPPSSVHALSPTDAARRLFAHLPAKLVGLLRAALAGHNTSRGLPGSDRFTAADGYHSRWSQQVRHFVTSASPAEFARKLVEKLKSYPLERGLAGEALSDMLQVWKLLFAAFVYEMFYACRIITFLHHALCSSIQEFH
jgi:hypothetical protein